MDFDTKKDLLNGRSLNLCLSWLERMILSMGLLCLMVCFGRCSLCTIRQGYRFHVIKKIARTVSLGYLLSMQASEKQDVDVDE